MSAQTIVVGAGSSGCVIASRLTEQPKQEVLLLEAGPDYATIDSVPSDLLDGRKNALHSHDWGFRHRVNNEQPLLFRLPRGRVVGGSSSVNTCIFLRGVPSDFDEWSALGLEEWSWNECLPFFKKVERDLDFSNEYHGTHGPIPVRRHPREELHPWQAALLDASAHAGFPEAKDHNDPTATGWGPHAMNKLSGRRMSASICYLTGSVRRRENLKIEARTLVHRVVTTNGSVRGIEIEQRGERKFVEARNVVLCAGAIETPGILLRSGIGPRSLLERLGVACVRDLPAVGARLLDHPGVAFFLWPRFGVADTAAPVIQTALRLASNRTPHRNDMQLQVGSFLHLPWSPVPLVSLMAQVGKPFGHGRIEWNSADPHVRPRIFSQLLEHPTDRAVAVDALQLGLRLAQSPPMRSLAKVFYPSEATLTNRDQLDSIIRRFCDSGYHPCGTVPMGPDESTSVALDPHGRVRGIEGLWVCDASAMPTIPTSNIHAPTLMMGERFAHWLTTELR